MKIHLKHLSLGACLCAGLLSNGAFAQEHAMGAMDHGKHGAKEHAVSTIKAEVLSIKNNPDASKNDKVVRFKLSTLSKGKPLTPKDLKVMHTQKVHLLIIDPSLSDYHHIHPTPVIQEPGVYEFAWNPQNQGVYRMWVDIVPIATDTQEYVMVDLPLSDPVEKAVDQSTILSAKIDGLDYALSFDPNELKVGRASMGTIQVLKDGKPFKELEPVMGAFAHIVGFTQDFQSVVHIHPMGKEPTDDTQRGGPELLFHINPEKTGFIKLFAQVQIDGKNVFIPFGLNVGD